MHRPAAPDTTQAPAGPVLPATTQRALQRVVQQILDQCRDGWDSATLPDIDSTIATAIGRLAEDADRTLGDTLAALQTALLPAVSRQHPPDARSAALIATLATHLQRQLVPAAEVARPRRKARILLVGLAERDADYVRECLDKRDDLEVLVVAEPLAVLEQLTRFQPKLIALNQHMRVCDCATLTAMIRERSDLAEVPIIELSSFPPDDTEEQVVGINQPPQALLAALLAHLPAGGDDADPRETSRAMAEHGRHLLLQRLEALLTNTSQPRGGLLEIGVAELDANQQAHSTTERRAMQAQLGQAIQAFREEGDSLCDHDAGFLFLSTTRNSHNMLALADSLLKRLAQERFGAEALPMSISIGGCIHDEHIDQVDAMLNGVHRARLAAGPDNIGWMQRGDGSLAPNLVQLALKQNRLYLVYQAIAAVGKTAQPRYQALLRMQDEDGFVHTAGELLPVARHAGLLPVLDRWTLKAALALLAQYQSRMQSLQLFVSQSAMSLQDKQYVPMLRQLLRGSGAHSQRLVLEFRCDDPDDVTQSLLDNAARFEALEVGLCLTGVGDSAANLDLLERLPLGYCKLSPRLNEYPEQVTRTAHLHGIDVIATRVEHDDELALLKSAGVDFTQGHKLAHPSRALNFSFAAQA